MQTFKIEKENIHISQRSAGLHPSKISEEY